MRGNPYVELVHWLHQILQLPDSDLHRIIRHFECEPARLAKDLTQSLDKLPRRGYFDLGFVRRMSKNAVERGWVYGTLMFGDSRVRTGHLIVGILKTAAAEPCAIGISPEFQKINVDDLTRELRFDRRAVRSKNTWPPPTASNVGRRRGPGEASGAMKPAAMGQEEALQQFPTDLTAQARDGKHRPDHRTRRGDPANRRHPDAPPTEQPDSHRRSGCRQNGRRRRFCPANRRRRRSASSSRCPLLTLDVGALQAGASMKGEFENRLKQVIEEVQASQTPIILFIDEAHTLIGAGGAAGTGDAANLLKPALARGQLRTIAATTWAEYKKHIEKDPALTRRFQVIQVDEPSEEKAILMMRSMASTLEKHHRVQILDEALEAAVRLSHRYIPARQLPDKSVSLLDTASARVAISQFAVPAEVDDSRRTIQSLETELEIIDNEKAIGIKTDDRESAAQEKLTAEKSRLAELEARWNEEKELVEKILDIRAKLRGPTGKVEGTASGLEQAADEMAKQVSVQTESAAPPTHSLSTGRTRDSFGRACRFAEEDCTRCRARLRSFFRRVDQQAVASVVSDWTGIPVGKMVKDEIATVLDLTKALNQRVIGQDHALEMIAKRIQTSRANLDNPNKPIGVFLLAGTSGVGKTETALALAETLYGGEQNVITINMSEFQEAAHRFDPQGRAARIRRLRRRRRADRGRPPPALQRRACWTKSKKPTPTCMRFSSRSSTKA